MLRQYTNQFVTDIPTGNRNITLVKSGYQTKTVWVDVPTGIKVLAPITLTPGGGPADTGTLYIASVPSGAEIYIDGVLGGTTNQFVTGVPAGTRNLTLNRSGYQPKTVWVDVPAGLQILAPIDLDRI
ncbi:MAG: PEGA domain-containing protein [Methanolinea sp.]|nr:MAG: PEGA domain-containing protein [Methanolinea sp.]